MVKAKDVPLEETIPGKLFILHWCKSKTILISPNEKHLDHDHNEYITCICFTKTMVTR
jgi:hypothetical protein